MDIRMPVRKHRVQPAEQENLVIEQTDKVLLVRNVVSK